MHRFHCMAYRTDLYLENFKGRVLSLSFKDQICPEQCFLRPGKILNNLILLEFIDLHIFQ